MNTLLDALARDPLPAVVTSGTGVTPQFLRAHVRSASECLDKSVSFPLVQSAFTREFTNINVFAKWLTGEYGPDRAITDDYPSVEVTARFTSGETVTARSHSWRPLMLPFEVTRGGSTVRTYDASLSRAVAELLPSTAINRTRLSDDGLLAQWTQQVCSMDTLPRVIAAAYIPNVIEMAHRMNLEGEFDAKPDLKSFGAELHLGSQHQIVVSFTQNITSPMDPNAVTSLTRAKLTLAQLGGLAWLKRGLKNSPGTAVRVNYEVFGLNWDIRDLQEAGPPGVASLLARHQRDVVDVSIYGAGDKSGSGWLLLPDGRLIMTAYYPDHNTFPFSSEDVDKIRKRIRQSWEGVGTAGSLVGLIVMPDGTVTASP